MKNTTIKSAFVSTNSIIQGESVGILWPFLFNKGIDIQFAHRSFSWSSESSKSATIHCVIIGMTNGKTSSPKKLYDCDRMTLVNHINGYLLDAPDVFIQSRGKPLTKGLPEMSKGSQPTDGGYLLMSEKERFDLVAKHPEAHEFIRPFVGSDDLIKGKKRFCLWLKMFLQQNIGT